MSRRLRRYPSDGWQTRDLFLHDYRPGPGDVVLKIGAGYRTETVCLTSRVGARGPVSAVEAHPSAVELPQRTGANTVLDNLTAVHVAIIDARMVLSISDRKADEYMLSSVVGGEGSRLIPSASTDDLVAVRSMATSAPLVRQAALSCRDFSPNELVTRRTGHGRPCRRRRSSPASISAPGRRIRVPGSATTSTPRHDAIHDAIRVHMAARQGKTRAPRLRGGDQ